MVSPTAYLVYEKLSSYPFICWSVFLDRRFRRSDFNGDGSVTSNESSDDNEGGRRNDALEMRSEEKDDVK